MNAAAVSQVPLVVFVWDDGYGISGPKELQTVKASISDALSGFEMSPTSNGIRIYRVKGWDYAQLCEAFEEGIDFARAAQVPVLFHVEDLTQPQGHSTSGSHERYKSPERLRWEKEWDCIAKMRSWIIDNALASETELSLLEDQSRTYVNQCRLAAWSRYDTPIQQQKKEALSLITHVIAVAEPQTDLETGLETLRHIHDELAAQRVLFRKDIMQALHQVMMKLGNTDAAVPVRQLYEQLSTANRSFYHSHLYFNQIEKPAQELPALEFTEESPQVNGYEILNHYFDELFTANPLVVAFGEDLGRIGDVNQGFAGLQQKYGKERIFDTGIRELTIMGQGVGLSMRGLRPIAEIQYIDYLLYGLQVLSDDVSTLHYRSVGSQIAPMIVRTRGHRLEGIWHSGSPMGILVNALKGMHICVPRNMVQAVGFYNTLLDGKDPGIIVECLNGYRLKERLPSNLLEYKIPLGVPEIVREGSDITVVSYGSTLRIVLDAAEQLSAHGIDAEVVDVQTLLPFDVHHIIGASLKKTNRILFVDEDVPGGASSFMFAEVMDKQGGYRLLDAAPGILCSQAHRPGYGSDGDYFSKPNAEDVIDKIRLMMAE
jgi:pyruvate/2-oxoglutarate/acetoin dehydrogenase E1 component